MEILGRVDDTVEFGGRRIYFGDFEEAVLRFARQFGTAVYFTIVTDSRLLLRVESENGKDKPSVESLDALRDKLGVSLKVDVCRKGELLDTDQLLRTPNVFKPHNVSDWRKGGRRCVTLSEALIEWPNISFRDMLGIAGRLVKNGILRRRLR
jgi:hypothetical protein